MKYVKCKVQESMVKPDKLLHMGGWVSGYKLCYDFLNVVLQTVGLRQMYHLTRTSLKRNLVYILMCIVFSWAILNKYIISDVF